MILQRVREVFESPRYLFLVRHPFAAIDSAVQLTRDILGNLSVTWDGVESASVQLVECEFEGGLLSRWQANLYPNSQSPPRPIDGEYLFTYTRNLDIAGAINKAWSDYSAEVEQ